MSQVCPCRNSKFIIHHAAAWAETPSSSATDRVVAIVSRDIGSTHTRLPQQLHSYLMVSLVRVLDKISADLKKQINKEKKQNTYTHTFIQNNNKSHIASEAAATILLLTMVPPSTKPKRTSNEKHFLSEPRKNPKKTRRGVVKVQHPHLIRNRTLQKEIGNSFPPAPLEYINAAEPAKL